MFWRGITKADLSELFSDHPAAFGAEIIGEAEACRAWHDLFSWPGFNGAAIEKHIPGRPSERLGFGASVFVSEAFARQEINHPRPGLNGRVLAEFTRHSGNVLGPQQIAEDNAAEGLNVLIFSDARSGGRTNRKSLKYSRSWRGHLSSFTPVTGSGVCWPK